MSGAMLLSDDRPPVDLIKRRLARNIALARNEQDPRVSQERLADMIGVARRQVIRWEKGEHRVSDRALVLIAFALERPIAWFYEDHEDGAR